MDRSQREFPQIEDEAEAAVRSLGLPPNPDILADIAREARRESPDAQKIAVLVTRDVAISASVLKTVNSAFYGLGSKARSVQQAIAYLGLDRTAFLMGALLLRDAFPRPRRSGMVRFWESCTQLALTAAYFCRVLDLSDPDEAHTFGLLRDAGSAVLMNKFDEYPGAVEHAGASASVAFAQEQERFGADHAVVGAVMARDWQLPEAMSVAILWHHAELALDASARPIDDESARFIALGVLADRVLERSRGKPLTEQTARITAQALDLLGVSQPNYADLQFEAMTLLDELEGAPAPTLRLHTIAR